MTNPTNPTKDAKYDFPLEYEPLLQAAWEARATEPYCFQEALSLLRKANLPKRHYATRALFAWALQACGGLPAKDTAKVMGCAPSTAAKISSHGSRYLTSEFRERAFAWAEMRARHIARCADFTLDKTINDLYARLSKLPQSESAPIVREIRNKYVDPGAIGQKGTAV